MIDPAPIRPRRHHPRREQRLDFRREKQPVALPRPVKRTDPKAIPPEHQPPRAFVPERDGKLPAQPLPHPRAMLLPHVRNDFRVAVLHQPMPARLQLMPLFEMIKKLAIKNDRDVSILVENWLLPVREPHDAQPPRPQREARPLKETLLIRSAMHDRARHAANDFVRHGSLIGEMEDACDAAHVVEPVVRNSLPGRAFFSRIIRRWENSGAQYAAAIRIQQSP